MKKFFLIAILIMASTVLFGQKKGPFSYPYYIKGVTEIDPNTGDINLKDIEFKGFECSGIQKAGISSEKARFIFEKIKTSPSISLQGKKLQYWRQDRSGEWVTDAEGGSGTFSDKLERDITIVMALDCSASMGSEYFLMKNGAISFLNKIYSTSNDGHIRLGIIGFSSITETDRQVFEIKPLTSNTFDQAKRFISSLSQESNTALYYAINKGTDMLEKYISSEFNTPSSTEYGGTYMLVFTDGLDNASQFREQKVFRSDDAYDYVLRKLNNTSIKGSSIETFIIGAKGKDLTSDMQIKEFRERNENLIPKTNELGKFIYLQDMSRLEETFRTIAESLTEQWQNLVCLTSLAHEGGVCWTLGNVAPDSTPIVKNTTNIFWGINGGLGLEMEGSPFTSGSIDFAYPLTKRFGLGAYVGTKYCGDFNSLSIGAITTLGNYHDGKRAFVGGIGYGYDLVYDYFDNNYYESSSINLRAGILYKSGLYIMSEVSAGSYGAVSLGIGFNFGKFIKINK